MDREGKCFTSDDGGKTIEQGEHNWDKDGYCIYCGKKTIISYESWTSSYCQALKDFVKGLKENKDG